jgi:SAM-dependent methyltransferase
MSESREWTRYYDATGAEPRETLLDALARFDEPGLAVDLGCGTGRDTFALLRAGWRVIAIDAEEEAIRRVRAGAGDDDPLETQLATFAAARWPECRLVNASYSLPFCPAREFDTVWERIARSLAPGGRFCGHLFGDRDEWAPDDEMSFHTRAEAESLFAAFELERFDEVEEDSTTATGEAKHWHLFTVVARKR